MALLRQPGAKAGLSVAQIQADGGVHAALDRRLGLFAAQAVDEVLSDLAEWANRGITAVPFTDPRYPAALSDAERRPPLLFVRGEMTGPDLAGVAVIGTRQPSPSGTRAAAAVAEALAAAGRTVVSGLAAGIDTAAHEAALRAGGRSLAVLGNGVSRVYPPANAELQRRLQVLVSQFWPDQPPSQATFPLRNAVMSAISVATVVIEAGERSGARIQARHALAQGRSLFLMAPLLREEWARTLARRPGARVISDPAELISEI